jgi:hypothetical protein
MKKSILFLIIVLFLIFNNFISSTEVQAEALLTDAENEASAENNIVKEAATNQFANSTYCKKSLCWCGRKIDFSLNKLYCPISAVNSCYKKYGYCVRKGNYCWWKYTFKLRNCLRYAW